MLDPNYDVPSQYRPKRYRFNYEAWCVVFVMVVFWSTVIVGVTHHIHKERSIEPAVQTTLLR